MDNQTQATNQSPMAESHSGNSPPASTKAKKAATQAQKENNAMEVVINELKQTQAVAYT